MSRPHAYPSVLISIEVVQSDVICARQDLRQAMLENSFLENMRISLTSVGNDLVRAAESESKRGIITPDLWQDPFDGEQSDLVCWLPDFVGDELG